MGGWVCGWGYDGGGGGLESEGEGVRVEEGSKATRQAGYHRYAATTCLLRYSPTVPTYRILRYGNQNVPLCEEGGEERRVFGKGLEALKKQICEREALKKECSRE